jgi:undecaprenyl-diphosphatase
MTLALKAAILGLIEGITEFLPVSSTGHLILIGHFLGFSSPGHSFEVLIQLGAILAITGLYAGRLIALGTSLGHDPEARRFVLGILLAFLPAALVGALMHAFIKEVLFSPLVVSITLILGGMILLYVDRLELAPRYRAVQALSLRDCVKIGLFQCLALVPGVSRSGATIIGAMLLGADRRTAAEFSFFLAMPTMAAAFTYDLYKNHHALIIDDAIAIGIGFVVAFASGWFVVKHLLDYVSRHGFAIFAFWRILVGCFGLAALIVYG